MNLKVHNLQFSYNGHAVLNSIRFELKAGEIIAVLGVNGAGKSTLLKCLNRILKPQSGTVVLGNRDVSGMSATERACCFGYVSQHADREPLTVFDTVLLGRKPHIKWSAGEHDFNVTDHVLQLTGLAHLAHRSADHLSGGELQKVFIARALAQEPSILLLDEPTSNLDLKNQIQVMDLVADAVRSQGISTIVSVHDINLALRYADRFILLKNGHIHSLTSRDGITPEAIRQVYGVEVTIGRVNQQRVVVPMAVCP